MLRRSRGAGENSVRLQSSDGETFEVSLEVAKLSRTLETMLRGQTFYSYKTHSTTRAVC